MGLQDYSGSVIYKPPSDMLSGGLLIVGLISAAPTAAYQASMSLAIPRLLLGFILFAVGVAVGHGIPIYGFSTLAILTASADSHADRRCVRRQVAASVERVWARSERHYLARFRPPDNDDAQDSRNEPTA